jgi:hypothetical protein
MIKSLRETNIHIKDPVQREKLVHRSVKTSCGAEGIESSDDLHEKFDQDRENWLLFEAQCAFREMSNESLLTALMMIEAEIDERENRND